MTAQTVACQAPLSMGFSRREYWSGLPFTSLEIFPTQESNPGLLHCRQIIYWLSYEGRSHNSINDEKLLATENWNSFEIKTAFWSCNNVFFLKKCSAKKVIPIDLDQRRNGNPLQYSCLENPMDRGAWRLQSMSHQELDMTEHTCTQALT